VIVAIAGNVKKLPTETYDEQYERILVAIEDAVTSSGFRVTEVCCGRKNGVDRAALLFAKRRNLPARHFSIRFQLCQAAEALIALHDGSKTTSELMSQMSRDGKLVHVVRSRARAGGESPPPSE
jgi:hypothetical protein